MKKENVKKLSEFSLLSLLTTIFSFNFVSALTGREITLKTSELITETLNSTIFLSTESLSKYLLGFLLWIIIFSIVKKLELFKSERFGTLLPTIVSLIIVILSFIYLPDNFVQAIVLQYGAMGAAILTIIPFIILLYFSLSVSKGLLLPRIIWIFYVVYYFALFAYKIVSNFEEKILISENIPYAAAILAGVFVFIFLKDLRKWLFKGQLSDQLTSAKQDVAVRAAGRDIERDEAKSRGITGK
ncbi:MAG: hypothetical protein KJ600_01655 [Nanoarchaeota archaeon]|nr:hypothetical protein [Nanoarchaeota archaeon]MBU1103244.1 hypothetical protein [Nanoarchaeota archaeon]